MPDIMQDLVIRAPAARVFAGVATPAGLDRWWCRRAEGEPRVGAEYELDFGPEYVWRARVTRCEPAAALEYELIEADDDWTGSRVGFELEERDGATALRFRHTGWREANAHFRGTSHCWALYLRVLRRWLEHGEEVPYEERLDV